MLTAAALAFLASFILLGFLWDGIEASVQRNIREEAERTTRPDPSRMATRQYVRPLRSN